MRGCEHVKRFCVPLVHFLLTDSPDRTKALTGASFTLGALIVLGIAGFV